MEHVITVEGLEVVRGTTTALDRIDWRVVGGQVVGLLGPSGSGKTTLLRALVGVQRVRAGQVTVLGLPAGHPRLRARVGYMTQAPAVYLDLSVTDNLLYGATLLGVERSQVACLLDEVDLTAQGRQLVGTLSGGQRSRVSLALALLGDPEVVVLDEPTVGLDPMLRTELWEGFHELARRGTTLLVSTHVMDEAERCDRLLLLRDGRRVAEGSPDELRERTGTTSLERAFLDLARPETQEVAA